jgi:spermidine synthase
VKYRQQPTPGTGRTLQIATWNIAAINNNPFEYWITYDENPAYDKIMTDIESFLETPGERDVPVSAVFTEDMFGQLEKRMNAIGWGSVRSYWDGDFKNRKIVSGFMKVSVSVSRNYTFAIMFTLSYWATGSSRGK